jgi:CheY-like chemotaxis protein
MRILFADDSAVSRSLVQAILAVPGHEITTAENGTDAWRLWQRDHQPVVIADWMMPGVDGLELCRKIRADPTGRSTYFILQTVRTGGTGEATEAGVSAYITKPIVPAELLDALEGAARTLKLQPRR